MEDERREGGERERVRGSIRKRTKLRSGRYILDYSGIGRCDNNVAHAIEKGHIGQAPRVLESYMTLRSGGRYVGERKVTVNRFVGRDYLSRLILQGLT